MANQFNYELCKDLIADGFSKQSKTFNSEENTYIGYGIRIHTSIGDFDIDDISISEKEVDKLIDILNSEDISLVHIENIIEDFINETNNRY